MIWLTVVALLSLGNSRLFASHTLDSRQMSVVTAWLSDHRGYRLASDRDCACDEDIQAMRAGSGGDWKPVPDYHPYVASGDFNGDGVTDFAVVVISTVKARDFTLLVFNGPVDAHRPVPAFVDQHRDLTRTGLFYGPPRPKPYRLLIGPFESEGLVVQPRGQTYRLVE
jgi:hypothetical protein